MIITLINFYSIENINTVKRIFDWKSCLCTRFIVFFILFKTFSIVSNIKKNLDERAFSEKKFFPSNNNSTRGLYYNKEELSEKNAKKKYKNDCINL